MPTRPMSDLRQDWRASGSRRPGLRRRRRAGSSGGVGSPGVGGSDGRRSSIGPGGHCGQLASIVSGRVGRALALDPVDHAGPEACRSRPPSASRRSRRRRPREASVGRLRRCPWWSGWGSWTGRRSCAARASRRPAPTRPPNLSEVRNCMTLMASSSLPLNSAARSPPPRIGGASAAALERREREDADLVVQVGLDRRPGGTRSRSCPGARACTRAGCGTPGSSTRRPGC